ncbi:MAG: PAS domain-containing protein, partial [Pseudomonadota bacterium]
MQNSQPSQDESQARLQLLSAIIEGSEDAIFAKDLEGRYLLFNRTACRLVGKPVEEVLGRDDTHLFPCEQAEDLRAFDHRVIAENDSITEEHWLTTADGGKRDFLDIKTPLRDAMGQVIGLT